MLAKSRTRGTVVLILIRVLETAVGAAAHWPCRAQMIDSCALSTDSHDLLEGVMSPRTVDFLTVERRGFLTIELHLNGVYYSQLELPASWQKALVFEKYDRL